MSGGICMQVASRWPFWFAPATGPAGAVAMLPRSGGERTPCVDSDVYTNCCNCIYAVIREAHGPGGRQALAAPHPSDPAEAGLLPGENLASTAKDRRRGDQELRLRLAEKRADSRRLSVDAARDHRRRWGGIDLRSGFCRGAHR